MKLLASVPHVDHAKHAPGTRRNADDGDPLPVGRPSGEYEIIRPREKRAPIGAIRVTDFDRKDRGAAGLAVEDTAAKERDLAAVR